MLAVPEPATGRGAYRYRVDGRDAEVDETFALSSAPDGTVRVAGTRRVPAAGSELLVEAERRPDGRVEVLVDWRDGEGAPRAARLDLDADADRVRARHTVDGQTGDVELRPAAGFLLFPLLRVFQGPLLRELAGREGAVPVVVPELRPGRAGWLLPRVDPRRAWRDGAVYRCVGGEYDERAEFEIDDDGWLRAYRWPAPDGRLWEVVLERADA